MESLAAFVSVLIVIMLTFGITGIFLTFKKTNELSNVTAKPLQRLFTLLISVIALFIGAQFFIQLNSAGGKLLGLFGITTGLIAIYRVFKK